MKCLIRIALLCIFCNSWALLSQQNSSLWLKFDPDTTPTPNAQFHIQTGSLPLTFFEKRLGGNDTSLSVWLIHKMGDTGFINLPQVLPIGFGILDASNVSSQCPVLVAIPQNMTIDSAFLAYFNGLDTQFYWFEKPVFSKESVQFIPLNIQEYILPLPCSDESLYVECISDSVIRVFWDDQIVNFESLNQVLPICSKFKTHMQRYHQLNCALELTIFFESPQINVVRVSEFMGDLSDLGFVIHTQFHNYSGQD